MRPWILCFPIAALAGHGLAPTQAMEVNPRWPILSLLSGLDTYLDPYRRIDEPLAAMGPAIGPARTLGAMHGPSPRSVCAASLA